MKTRHRTPAIFSGYMVDVLCCALGCVILLWLINQRYAQQRADAAGATPDGDRQRDEHREDGLTLTRLDDGTLDQ